MKSQILGLLASVLIVAQVQAKPSVISFDDLPAGYVVPDGYFGLDWNNFAVNAAGASGAAAYDATGYGPGTVSAPNVAYNVFGYPADISSSRQFGLVSGYFTGAWDDGLRITVDGYLNGVLEDTKLFTVSATAPSLETFDWRHINSVTFTAEGGTQYWSGGSGPIFVLDNLEITSATHHMAAPEFDPSFFASAIALLIGSLLILGSRRGTLVNGPGRSRTR